MTAGPRHEGDDRVLPFAVEGLDVRGRVVRLGPALNEILSRHAYPAPVSRVVGEAAALTVLLGSSLKLEGSLQLQTRSDGPLEMIVIDFDAPDRLRACARFDAARVADAERAGAASTGELLGRGHLAFTIDQGPEMTRYQGVVPLEGQDLEQAAHQYFRQSEQIPTRVRLAVGEELTSEEGGARASFRAGGLLVQFLPRGASAGRDRDLEQEDAWLEAKLLADTAEDHELIDPTLPSERLLYRLFHERGVRVFEAGHVHEACRCSREKILTMLRRFPPEEQQAMIGDDGRIGVTCEFCSRHYEIDPAEIGRGEG